MNWATPHLNILFLSALTPAQDCKFYIWKDEHFCKIIDKWTMETSLSWRRWRGRRRRLESGWLCSAGRDFQGDLVWIDLQFILQPLFVMCFASSCTLNLNCSKLNYRDQTAHISIRTTKYCTWDTSALARLGLYTREEGKGVLRRTFDWSWIALLYLHTR